MRYRFVGHTFAEAREAIRRARLGPMGCWLEDRTLAVLNRPFGKFGALHRAEDFVIGFAEPSSHTTDGTEWRNFLARHLKPEEPA